MASTMIPKRRTTTTQTEYDPNAPASTPPQADTGATYAPSAGGNAGRIVPMRPAQQTAIEQNAQTAYANAAAAANAPRPKTEYGGGEASITLEDGRTITRRYTPRRDTYDETITTPGAATVYGSGLRAALPTPAQADQIQADRAAYADRQTRRGDALLTPIRGSSTTSYDREAAGLANDAARTSIESNRRMLPLTADQLAANTNLTNAQAASLNAGGAPLGNAQAQLAVYKAQLDQVNRALEMERQSWARERAQIIGQQAKPAAAPKPDAPLTYNAAETSLITGTPAGVDAKGQPTPAVPPSMTPEGLQALKRGQYGSPTTRPGAAAPAAAPAPQLGLDVQDSLLQKYGLSRVNGRIVDARGTVYVIRADPADGMPTAYPAQ